MSQIFIVNHPSSEPIVYGIGKDRYAAEWNFDKSHHRKYIERSGVIVSSHNTVTLANNLLFWGEYEPLSYCRKVFGKSTTVKYVHDDLCPVGTQCRNIPVMNYAGECMNTDPYVYGKEFYTICCKRKHAVTYTNGDIILFGNLRRSLLSGIYDLLELDTVIVVKELRPIECFDPETNFYKSTIIPLLLNGKLTDRDVIVGRQFVDMNTPFSFVPCNKASNSGGQYGAKPVVNLTNLGARCPRVANGRIPVIQNAPLGIWQKILSSMDGFLLAVEFDEVK